MFIILCQKSHLHKLLAQPELVGIDATLGFYNHHLIDFVFMTLYQQEVRIVVAQIRPMVAVIVVTMDIEIGHVLIAVEIEFEAEVFDIILVQHL